MTRAARLESIRPVDHGPAAPAAGRSVAWRKARPAALCIAVAGLALPHGGAAQADSTSVQPIPIDGYAQVSAGFTRIYRDEAPVVGAALLFAARRAWRVGGEGRIVARAIPLDVPEGFPETDLTLGYGGVLIERWQGEPSDIAGSRAGLGIAVLAGAGVAEVREAVSRVRLDSDNFVVVEPTLSSRLRLFARLAIDAALSYRLVSGLDGIDAVDDADVAGWSARLGVRVGPF